MASQTELMNDAMEKASLIIKTGLYEEKHTQDERIDMFLKYCMFLIDYFNTNEKSKDISNELIKQFDEIFKSGKLNNRDIRKLYPLISNYSVSDNVFIKLHYLKMFLKYFAKAVDPKRAGSLYEKYLSYVNGDNIKLKERSLLTDAGLKNIEQNIRKKYTDEEDIAMRIGKIKANEELRKMKIEKLRIENNDNIKKLEEKLQHDPKYTEWKKMQR